MEISLIQKQLNDLSCFKDHYMKMDIAIYDGKGNLTFEDEDCNTSRIQIRADNPYQLNIIVEFANHHKRIYHLCEDATMSIYYGKEEKGAVVFISDHNHCIDLFLTMRTGKTQSNERA